MPVAGRKRALRVLVQKTKRTDLVCMACGQFRTELEVVLVGEFDPHVGVHARCVGLVHHKRAANREESLRRERVMGQPE